MGRILMAALSLLLASSVAQADEGRKPLRDRIEASMLVPGTIHVDPQGRVEKFEIAQRETLPEPVKRLLDQAIPAWRFEPTLHDGKPAHVETSMRIRVAATKQGEDAVALRIAGASFGGQDPTGENEPNGQLFKGRLAPPSYPRAAIRHGAMATVHILGRVGLDGTMQEAIAEQVNLRFMGRERVMDEFREDFAKASISAAMRWKFNVPGDVDRSKGYWSVRVPVDFSINDFEVPGPREWDSYIPGPRQTAWWVEDDASQGGDSYASGGVYPVGTGLKLLTPLEANG